MRAVRARLIRTPWLIKSNQHQRRASSSFSPKPLLCLPVSLGTTNRIAPQFRQFSLLCFCEIEGEEIFKLNFTFLKFVYIQFTALQQIIAIARCKEAKFKVAKRHPS